MSHSGIYHDSFDHTIKRYGRSAGAPFDPLASRLHVTHDVSIFPKKLELSNEGTLAPDTEVTYKLPTSGYLHHIALKQVLTATATANYSDYPAFNYIKKVKLEVDGNTLQDYHYEQVIMYYLMKLNDEEARDKVLTMAGGSGTTTTSATTVVAPIPLFFDPIVAPGVGPLNLAKFQKPPELKITYRATSETLENTATGGGLTSSRMLLYMTDTTQSRKRKHNEKDYFYKSVDFVTNNRNTVATATETDIDISGFAGMVQRVIVQCRAVATAVGTNNDAYTLSEIDTLKVDLDGHVEHVFRTAQEGEQDFINYNHGKGFSSTLGYPYIIPHVNFAERDYATAHIGGIHSSKVNKHLLKVQHSVGADAYVDVLGLRNAMFVYKNGTMERLL